MTQPSLTRQRPPSVLVLAILLLVGGSIGLLLGLCGIVSQLFLRPWLGRMSLAPGPNSPKVLLEDLLAIPGYQAMAWTALIGDLILSILMLTGGMGLLGMRPWGRTVSLIYAPLSILNRIGLLVWHLAVILPATMAVFEKHAATNPMFQRAMASTRFSIITQVVWAIIALSYPVVVLIILNLRQVRAAFSGKWAAVHPALPDDEGWGPMKRPGASTDVTTRPDADRDRFRPPT